MEKTVRNIYRSNDTECENCRLYTSDIPWNFSEYRFLYCTDGVVEIEKGGKKLFCRSNQAVILLRSNEKSVFSGRKFEAYCMDFSGPTIRVLLDRLGMQTEHLYDIKSNTLIPILESAEKEFHLDITLGKGIMMTSFVSQLFTEISRQEHDINLAAEEIGINGFSWKRDVAARTVGKFHGKHCVRITPLAGAKGLVVLENYCLSGHNIDLKKYKYMQMGYYYETSSNIRRSASLRIINFQPPSQDRYVMIYDQPYGVSNNFFAPLKRNRWSHATFCLSYPTPIRNILDSHETATLRQIKINPFGLTDISDLPSGDKMYISSVTFYKNDPDEAFAMKGTKNINAVMQLMDENFARNLPVKFYADACFLSTSRFEHWFRQKTGMSPVKYINSRRMEYAKIYFTDMTEGEQIQKVAHDAGFSDARYFSRLFKKETGYTPMEYIKMLKNHE